MMEQELTIDEFCDYMSLVLSKFKEHVKQEHPDDLQVKRDWIEVFGSFEEFRGE